MPEVREVVVMVGSASDLPQCIEGLQLLKAARGSGQITMPVDGVTVMSIHRNTKEVLEHLTDLHDEGSCDVLIVGAGWANHLTGTADAYLRNVLGDEQIVVIGVAFEDPKDPQHTKAAKLSISQVPGTQVVFRDEEGQFVGKEGFRRACAYAIGGELPVIKLPKPRPVQLLTLDEAISKA